ncbi:MAG: NAD(P)H-hydrate dehydratase [Ferrovibrio sp.]
MTQAAALLTVGEMAAADRAAIAGNSSRGGVPGLDLMEAAGAAVARMVQRHHPQGAILVLCGPGNNGGDGFVAARLLKNAGRSVTLALLGTRDALKGDAAEMARRWSGAVLAATPLQVMQADVIVDALFGAGLSKPLEGMALALVDAVNESGAAVVAVDLPSGLHGDDGQPRGAAAIRATRTVTFFRPKPGHLLLPGRLLCGDLHVAEIGIPDAVLAEISPQQWRNDPALWRAELPRLRIDGHKYQRGHVLLRGGDRPGAALLAGHAALRIGAGLATVALPQEAMALPGGPDALMRQRCDGIPGWRAAMKDSRRNALLLGPGNGAGAATRQMVLDALVTTRPTVLDADALTVFADNPKALFAAIRGPVVLTPHDGEFARLFPDLVTLPKLARTRMAAKLSNAVILLKGADTVIADPDGRAAINSNAPPDLATAGAGDVLAGFCVGLLAQGMPAFEAACAATWLHGEAAKLGGAGLIADDLPLLVRTPLTRLRMQPG